MVSNLRIDSDFHRPRRLQRKEFPAHQLEIFHASTEIPHDVIVFDVETTWTSPREIIQLAAIRISRGKVVSGNSFFSYVKPNRKIDPRTTEFTGITNRQVSKAPPIKDVLFTFSNFCGDFILIAHGGHTFEFPLIRKICARLKCSTRQVRYVDSVHISRSVFSSPGLSHKLEAVASRLRVRNFGIRLHDARGDVKLLAGCVSKLFRRLGCSGQEHHLKIYEGVLPDKHV